MNVLVIGANGKIGRLLVEKLAMEKAFRSSNGSKSRTSKRT